MFCAKTDDLSSVKNRLLKLINYWASYCFHVIEEHT